MLGPLSRREDLPSGLVEAAMATILSGTATPAQIAAFAVLLRAKGETPVELAALVRTMLQFSEPIPIDPEGAPSTAGRHVRHRAATGRTRSTSRPSPRS